MLATLIRHVGDFDLAEEAVQDAFAKAVATWPRDGTPEQPGAWLTVTARRYAIDRLRRAAAQRDRARGWRSCRSRTRTIRWTTACG